MGPTIRQTFTAFIAPKDGRSISDSLANKMKELRKRNEEIGTAEEKSSAGSLEDALKNVVKGGCGSGFSHYGRSRIT